MSIAIRFELATPGVPAQFVRIDFEKDEGDLTLQLRDSAGQLLRTSNTELDREQISLDGLSVGIYVI